MDKWTRNLLWGLKNILKEHWLYAYKHLRAYIETFVHFVHLSRMEVKMPEKQIEQKLTKAVKNMGGIALKLVSPGFDGMPDRLILLPRGRLAFVEVKAPGKTPRPLQVSRHGMLRQLGFKVYILDDEGQIGGILDEICTS